MSYNFSNLSPADFEDLARDLIGRELNVRFEAFAAGPDGGMDGRHSANGESIILQAKHRIQSTFSALKAAMRRERSSIDALAPQRYILATSRPLTPENKKVLAEIIGPSLKSEADIFGPEDLNALLAFHSDIARAHIKLWLSNTTMLERVIRSAAHNHTAISRSEIENKVKIYAQNPSFAEARLRLEEHHVLIISGPPGVGKTTLAEMLAYAYLGEEWEFVAVRSLEDGFSSIVDAKKQIFFFDDFLGKIALDARALSTKDSDLAKFIRRIRATPNARFVLTTRAYLFEEARRISEYLADEHLNIIKYVLDVGVYTRRIKARILYNHLVVNNVPITHIRELWQADAIPKIVDHKNYNPRIIEAMTDSLRVLDILAAKYPEAFIGALDNPNRIWDTAFRTHISSMCRHLLIVLFFCSEYGTEIDDLKSAYDSLHASLSKKYGERFSIKDFEEALKILEGGFIAIRGTLVQFINPSLRDFLAEYLMDVDFISDIARAATGGRYASSIWRYSQSKFSHANEQKRVAESLMSIACELVHLPRLRRLAGDAPSYAFSDLSNAERISLLLEWWKATKNAKFSELALVISRSPIDGFEPWLDGPELVDLVCDIRENLVDEFPNAEELANALEHGLIQLFEGGIWPDDLLKLCDAIDGAHTVLKETVFAAAQNAIEREIDHADSMAAAVDSESTLDDYIEAFQKLGPRANIAQAKLNMAIATIQDRIEQINEWTPMAKSPTLSRMGDPLNDSFDNRELRNLFEPLILEEKIITSDN